MTAAWAQFGISIVLLAVCPLVAQTAPIPPASISDVRVVRTDQNIRVEITLSGAVQPSAVTAGHPDRIVLELPNTLSDSKQQHIQVNVQEVYSVRYGLHSANPPVTHLVVDLD